MSTYQKLLHSDITEKIIKGFYEVYSELGFGFLENVYENALSIVLTSYDLIVEQQKLIPVVFRGNVIGEYKADLTVENKVIVEVKAIKMLMTEHEAQILNYLKATQIEVGLLVNFGPKLTYKRFVFNNERKNNR